MKKQRTKYLYRKKEETQQIFRDTDPLKKFREKMAETGIMAVEECDAIDAKCDEKIKAAKEFAMNSPFPDENSFMKYVYED